MKAYNLADLPRILDELNISNRQAALENIPIVHHGMNSSDDTAYQGINVGIVSIWVNKDTGKMIFNEYKNDLGLDWIPIKGIVIG